MKKPTLLLSSLMLIMGLNVTACSKHEATGETHKTEEIAAEQGEIAKANNPAPTASQPASPMPTANTASASATTTTTKVVTTTTASAPMSADASAGDAGEKLYNTTCKTCHEPGLTGAPKFGDKAAWKDRIAQGKDTLHKHAIEGFQGKAGMMPPKGGNAAASDSDVKAAVDYMVSKAS